MIITDIVKVSREEERVQGCREERIVIPFGASGGLWPSRLRTNSPVFMFHTLALLSEDPVTSTSAPGT